MSTVNPVNVPRWLVLFELFFPLNITNYFFEEWYTLVKNHLTVSPLTVISLNY